MSTLCPRSGLVKRGSKLFSKRPEVLNRGTRSAFGLKLPATPTPTPVHAIVAERLDPKTKLVKVSRLARSASEILQEVIQHLPRPTFSIGTRLPSRIPFPENFNPSSQRTSVVLKSSIFPQVSNHLYRGLERLSHFPRYERTSNLWKYGQRNFCTGRALQTQLNRSVGDLMSSKKAPEGDIGSSEPAQHKPLVVGLTKPKADTTTASSTETANDLNEAIKQNVASNTASAAPATDEKPTKKKEKAPKQPKQPKAAPVAALTSPALIDLRVGHILRAIAHHNAEKLYVSTIAMGDPEGTEHTQVDEETGKVVRTVCSGLKEYIPLEEMQNRKIVVVANLKPVTMRSIKSAAMVLAASPKQEEGADPHAPDRVVELVVPPEGSEAGDKVYFEGWPYGDGKGPEKQLNPKKKQWEAIQPGFYTSDDLKVGFDAGVCEDVSGSDKGLLVVEGKGPCTVPTLKGAVVR